MTTQTEALKLALEALELVVLRQKEAAGKQIDAPEITRLWSALTDCIPTITAIKEALAQPEQEPVIGTKTWFEDGKLVTQHLTAKDIYKDPEQPEQEPISWAEFDGEGGYHFRAYENNEDYAEQWDKRNPNHVGWVKPLYTTPPKPEQEPDHDKK